METDEENASEVQEVVDQKEKKKTRSVEEVEIKKPKARPNFEDLGGIQEIKNELTLEVVVPILNLPLCSHLGVTLPTDILFHGPPGVGKKTLAEALANELGIKFHNTSASGVTAEIIRDLFSKAYETAPSIVFIDEIDAIGSGIGNLLREMARLPQIEKRPDVGLNLEASYVLVIGSTNRPYAVDPYLKRHGMFGKEIVFPYPNLEERREILSVLTQNCRGIASDFDIRKLATSTPGFVAVDLRGLVDKAGQHAFGRFQAEHRDCLGDQFKRQCSPEEMERFRITMADFEEATKMVQPSLRRKGFFTIPNVKWDDIVGHDGVRKEINSCMVKRIKHPREYQDFVGNYKMGFLLHGPRGCGKSLIAKAVANETGANFIHIRGLELVNTDVGESEWAVKTLFSRARACSPCIIFFDKVDSLLTRSRGVELFLQQLIIELDAPRYGVFVIGATERYDLMKGSDLLKQQRFGIHLHVPLPDPVQRGLILSTLGREKVIVDDGVDLIAIGKSEGCKGLSGGDLGSLMGEAALNALDEKVETGRDSSDAKPLNIKITHIEKALKDFKRISGSVDGF